MLLKRRSGWPSMDWTRPFEELERLRRQMDFLKTAPDVHLQTTEF